MLRDRLPQRLTRRAFRSNHLCSAPATSLSQRGVRPKAHHSPRRSLQERSKKSLATKMPHSMLMVYWARQVQFELQAQPAPRD